uniref:Molybdopterin oxidoreductase n=1 Tax=Haemonchus placei TaxID=6290 RepID=A0A0N4WJZ9_HAEPC
LYNHGKGRSPMSTALGASRVETLYGADSEVMAEAIYKVDLPLVSLKNTQSETLTRPLLAKKRSRERAVHGDLGKVLFKEERKAAAERWPCKQGEELRVYSIKGQKTALPVVAGCGQSVFSKGSGNVGYRNTGMGKLTVIPKKILPGKGFKFPWNSE